MKKRLLSALLALAMLLALFPTVVFAEETDFGVGDTGTAEIAPSSGVSVYKSPNSMVESNIFPVGTAVNVLEAYVTENRHYVEATSGMMKGKKGYIDARKGNTNTLKSINITGRVDKTYGDKKAEQEAEKAALEKTESKYTHDIDLEYLADYMPGGAKSLDGKAITASYTKKPAGWEFHLRPESLKLVGKAVLHIGDAGKQGKIAAAFYPGKPPKNYHQERLNDLAEIGYYPQIGDVYANASNANTAFFAYTDSEFDVVAYNDKYVAVWDRGGLDVSKGVGNPCGGSRFAQYASYRPGVYFFARENCYILDIDNQLAKAPDCDGVGTATCGILIKTAPETEDYVKTGLYKTNQSFQVIDATPINGHYKVYYRGGAYYVNANYVNLKLVNVTKPAISHTAIVDTGELKSVNIRGNADIESERIGIVKTGALIEVVQKDYNDTYSKIWFNSKECYIQTKYLKSFKATPNGSGIAQLGSPIGVMVIDSPWRAYGEATYTASQLEQKKKYIGATKEEQKSLKVPTGKKMVENDWANVYKVEEYAYTLYSWSGSQEKTATIYTIVFDGEVRYVIDDGKSPGFTYYPGNGYSKQTAANTQKIYVDLNEYDVLAYNINGNNYFKIRDIAKMMEGTSKIFDIEYDAGTNSINMIGYFDYKEVGGELAKGDGIIKTAYASSAFLTYDGVPVSVTCYNIDGNNYFKLRELTDALDCRVEWNSRNKVINITTTLSAKEDPNEAKG